MKYFILILSLWSANKSAWAQHADRQPSFNVPQLDGDSVVFTMTLINAYPFISAELNGVKGKFMFDTGSRPAISINENALKLSNLKENGKGFAGSGQSFTKHLADTVSSLVLSNGMAYDNLLNIETSNYDFLQTKITPDFLGFIGYEFFNGYTFKLDYLRKKITFYKNTPKRKLAKDFLINEKVIAVINFETRALPNHPLIKIKVGNVDILGSFDTGQYGLVQLEENAKEHLKRNLLLSSVGFDGNNDELIQIKEVQITKDLKITLKGIYPFSLEQAMGFRKAIQITEPNYMSIGYRFFDQFKTIWDYDQKKIYVLEL